MTTSSVIYIIIQTERIWKWKRKMTCSRLEVVLSNRAPDKVLFSAEKYWYFSYFSTKTITKPCLYNVDPLKSHFYIAKLGFTGVYIIFLIFAPNHRLWVLVRTASPSTHNLCFEQNMKNIVFFYLKIFSFGRWNFLYIWIACFREDIKLCGFAVRSGYSLLVYVCYTFANVVYSQHSNFTIMLNGLSEEGP